MTERDVLGYRRGNRAAARAAKPPFTERWHGRLALLLLGIALLTLSFAPFGQFYLAYVGLVPWLLALRRVRSQRAAFLWYWLAGTAFFLANMWWLAYVTAPGMVALMFMQGAFWAVAALVIRGTRLLDPYWRVPAAETLGFTEPVEPRPSAVRVLLAVLLVPAVWASVEWVRGNFPLNGLPWLLLGQTQTPALPMCQVADVTGVYGVSYWVAAVNVLVAMAIVHRHRLRRIVPAGLAVVAMTAGVAWYGVHRLAEPTTSPGPTVTVVQPNYPQSNTGDKGAGPRETVDFHVKTTDRELTRLGAGKSDLVVWSETTMPPMNPEARQGLLDYSAGALSQRVDPELADYSVYVAAFCDQTAERLRRLAATHDTALLVGGTFERDWKVSVDPDNGRQRLYPADRRNVAYFVHPTGGLSPKRYDKVHIVPFGEYLPGKDVIPPLYKLFVWLSPYPTEYFLQPGSEDQLTVFDLPRRPGADGSGGGGGQASGGDGGVPWRFVTPICFEDIDPSLVAKMFRGSDGAKRADLIVNITNDGWFRFSEMPQHLQCAVFRSIENRVPTARSVNTGISGFIDSTGRTSALIPAGTEGVRTATLSLDSRYTFYTRRGDVFAIGCAGLTGVMAAAALVRWWGRRAERRAAKPTKTANASGPSRR